MNKYEGIFILSNLLNDEAINKMVEKIEGEIIKAGGVVKQKDNMGRRQFARRLAKVDSGCYIKIIFEMAPLSINNFRDRLKLMEEIFRFQITKADKFTGMVPSATGEVKNG